MVSLRFFQDIIVRAETSEEVMVPVNFEGESIEHVDACLPAVFVPFHLLEPNGRMITIGYKELYLFIKFSLDDPGKVLIILLKGVGTEDFHFFRSVIRSSTESNDLVFPAAISLSASASASSQLNSLKYGGRVRAYLISSETASSVSVFFADFLYRSISSNTSSVKVIVNALDAILYSFDNKIPHYELLRQSGHSVFVEDAYHG